MVCSGCDPVVRLFNHAEITAIWYVAGACLRCLWNARAATFPKPIHDSGDALPPIHIRNAGGNGHTYVNVGHFRNSFPANTTTRKIYRAILLTTITDYAINPIC